MQTSDETFGQTEAQAPSPAIQRPLSTRPRHSNKKPISEKQLELRAKQKEARRVRAEAKAAAQESGLLPEPKVKVKLPQRLDTRPERTFEEASADILAELRTLRARYKRATELEGKKLDAERSAIMQKMARFRRQWATGEPERMAVIAQVAAGCRWRPAKKGSGGHVVSGGLPTLSGRAR